MHVQLYTWSSCSFCDRARALLERYDVAYSEAPLDGDRRQAEALAELFGRHVMPFALIDGEPVGGIVELERLAREGAFGAPASDA